MHSVTCGIRSLFHQKAVPASTVRVLTAVTTFYFCANMLVLKRRRGGARVSACAQAAQEARRLANILAFEPSRRRETAERGRARARKQLQKRGCEHTCF